MLRVSLSPLLLRMSNCNVTLGFLSRVCLQPFCPFYLSRWLRQFLERQSSKTLGRQAEIEQEMEDYEAHDGSNAASDVRE